MSENLRYSNDGSRVVKEEPADSECSSGATTSSHPSEGTRQNSLQRIQQRKQKVFKKPQIRAQRTSRPLEESADPDKLATSFLSILQAIRQHSAAWPFLKPVVAQEVPDYYDHIKYPMDLKTMGERLKKGYYVTRRLFMADMARIFSNCRLYNSPDTEYYRCANSLERYFQTKMKELSLGQMMFNNYDVSYILDAADPDKLATSFLSILQAIRQQSTAWPFLKPVVAQEVPDYYDYIKYPMDLKTVGERLKKGYYVTRRLFMADMARIFSNCRLYNSPDTEYYRCANSLERYFQTKMKELGLWDK